MDFFGYRLEKVNKLEEQKLEEAIATLTKHGFRAVRVTKDKSRKVESMKKANETRTQKVIEKIKDSIQELKDKEEKINVANIVRLTGVSRITAKKYLYIILNENSIDENTKKDS